MNIPRLLRGQIENWLFKGKILVIYGARQVGKTTLVRQILEKYKDSQYLSCEEIDVREALTNKSSTELKAFLGNYKLVVLDEAQRVKNIGLTLKLLADNYPEIQIIATGSSSFDLSNKVVEPLTGRHIEFLLYPFSMNELNIYFGSHKSTRLLERRLIYGMYPGIVVQDGPEVKKLLEEITRSYLYRDILVFQNLKNSESLEVLLRALALQIGNEVSYSELAQLVGIDKNTIMDYIQILEKAFIIFRLRPFSRNIRNELKKLRKIYFYDNGIRNALVNNFNPLNLRNDVSVLWENFMISERMKRNQHTMHDPNKYFWRTHTQQEIDYIEDEGGRLEAFEFKWKNQKFIPPKVFLKNYPGSSIKLITCENFADFLK